MNEADRSRKIITDPERIIAVVTDSVAQVPAETRWATMMGLVAIPLSLLLMGLAGLPGERLLAVVVIALVLVIREPPCLWEQYRERTRAGKMT